jgi:hypothetical protein
MAPRYTRSQHAAGTGVDPAPDKRARRLSAASGVGDATDMDGDRPQHDISVGQRASGQAFRMRTVAMSNCCGRSVAYDI